MGISKFEERKFLKWGDFLIELEEKYPIKSFKKDEKKYIQQLIEKGDDYQEQLNEEWLPEGFITYKHYMKQMYKYINLQDMIIENIEKYVNEVKEV